MGWTAGEAWLAEASVNPNKTERKAQARGVSRVGLEASSVGAAALLFLLKSPLLL